MNRFKDTPNCKDVIERIKNLSNIGEIIEYIKILYPEWIKSFHPCFSSDYNILNKNWVIMCDKVLKTSLKDIILVEEDEFKSDSDVLNTCCEILTRSGFLIRKYDNYVKCQNCDRLIPTIDEIKKIQTINKKLNLQFPGEWMDSCTECTKDPY